MSDNKKKKEKKGEFPNKATQFSKDYQPSPKAKSEGKKKFFERKRLKEDIYKEFAEETIETTSGQKISTWQALALMLKQNLLNKERGISKTEKAKIALKLFELITPKEVDNNISLVDKNDIIKVEFVSPKATKKKAKKKK